MTLWAILAIQLFLLTPLLHLHDSSAAGDEGAWSARDTSPSACSVCKFQSSVAIGVAEATFDSPHTRSLAIVTFTPTYRSADTGTLSARAPPQILG